MDKILYDDLYRYTGKRNFRVLLRYVFFTPSFRYIFYFRMAQYAQNTFSRIFWKFLLRRFMLKTGIQIPIRTKIGAGFRIVHFGHIIVNPNAIIGKNFNVYPGVTIGHSEGKKFGSPVIGKNVCILSNAIVVGGITIGDNVVIAPNSFVNFDVPANSIVIGNPGMITVKDKPSQKYIVYAV